MGKVSLTIYCVIAATLSSVVSNTAIAQTNTGVIASYENNTYDASQTQLALASSWKLSARDLRNSFSGAARADETFVPIGYRVEDRPSLLKIAEVDLMSIVVTRVDPLFQEMCLVNKSRSVDVLSLANSLKAIEAADAEVVVQTYQNLASTLEPISRSTLERTVQDRMASVKIISTEYHAIAAEYPEHVHQVVSKACNKFEALKSGKAVIESGNAELRDGLPSNPEARSSGVVIVDSSQN